MVHSIPIIRAKNGDSSYFRQTPVGDWANVWTYDGYSVLSASVMNNHIHCTKVIYARCPDLLYSESRDLHFSPLHLAAYRETHPSLIKFLISVADRKLLRMTDALSSTPLQLAILKSRMEAVNLLIEADPDQLSLVHEFRATPVLEALRVSYGKTDDDISVTIRRLVLQKQPSACKIRTGELGWTALHDAASEGDLGPIEDIIRFCPDSVHMVDNEGHDFLDIASVFGHSQMVKKILQKKDLYLANMMSKREEELCIPPEYFVLYRELVNQFGEIVEASKRLEEEDATRMYAALERFLGHMSEMVHVETGNVTQETISEWKKMAAEYSALGLQVSWFQELVARYSDWFAKRAEYEDDIVTKEATIATKKEALKILQNELNELNTEVAKVKKQRDTYAPESEDPLYVIRRIDGINSKNSAAQKLYTDLREMHRTRSNKFVWRKFYADYREILDEGKRDITN